MITRPRWRRWFARFGVRVYVLGLLQFAAIAAGVLAIMSLNRPHMPVGEDLRFVVEGLEQTGEDPARVAKETERIEHTLGWSIAIFDQQAHKIAGSLDVADPPHPRHPGDGPPQHGRWHGPKEEQRVPLHHGSGPPWWLVVGPVHPRVPTSGILMAAFLVIAGVGVSSWFTARSLSKPLQRLSEAARAFGRGKLTTRTALDRQDELGDVSVAFDHMAEQLAAALRAERELLANVSHELRTPLQRIHIAVELAAEGDAEMARESLAEITEDLRELERIVEDVLAAARLGRDPEHEHAPSSALPLRTERTELADVVERAATRFRGSHPERPLAVRIDPDLGAVEADGMMLRRVLDNLLENAHAYSDSPAAAIAVRAAREGASYVVEVRDHGVGLAPADLQRVFEPFFRADRSRSRGTGGLGLGLTLSRRIVESHGGTLSLESELGQGTLARVTLAAYSPDTQSHTEPMN